MTLGIRTYFNMVTVPNEMVRFERMSDCRGFIVLQTTYMRDLVVPIGLM